MYMGIKPTTGQSSWGTQMACGSQELSRGRLREQDGNEASWKRLVRFPGARTKTIDAQMDGERLGGEVVLMDKGCMEKLEMKENVRRKCTLRLGGVRIHSEMSPVFLAARRDGETGAHGKLPKVDCEGGSSTGGTKQTKTSLEE